eukprot:TRINITY_DN110785_c0_g1_i1.p1 TRINITY_DN110785_c0_g1~~TRINITY_DN110785_c0_g1_i1.p1  ORF type:complete len:209 (-),score=15.41 TRINITY_DN110785_c0_g1_i1:51-677(-)
MRLPLPVYASWLFGALVVPSACASSNSEHADTRTDDVTTSNDLRAPKLQVMTVSAAGNTDPASSEVMRDASSPGEMRLAQRIVRKHLDATPLIPAVQLQTESVRHQAPDDSSVQVVTPKRKTLPRAPGQGPPGEPGIPGPAGAPGQDAAIPLTVKQELEGKSVKLNWIVGCVVCQLIGAGVLWQYFSGSLAEIEGAIEAKAMHQKVAG